MKILGIESSCDETAVAIVNENKEILSNIVVSQIDIHKEFGGVIPEIASRNHLDVIEKIILKALKDANLKFEDLDAIAATCGPGLMGGLIVGAITAQSIASVFNKPFIEVNHLEGHILTSRLTNNLEFPFLIFLISGGHSQILLANGVGNYEKIGDTIDDSLGECFDKVAQMLGLEYPGGPKIEKLAQYGDENRFKFVKPLIDAVGKGRSKENDLNFSFSGLKTAVRREIEKITGEDYNYSLSHTKLDEQTIKDICASFQKTIVEILQDRFKNTVKYLKNKEIVLNKLIFAGGVSANQYIKNNMIKFCEKYGYEIITPPLKLCTDNGVMVAWAGLEKFRLGLYEKSDVLSIKSRWELDGMDGAAVCLHS